MSARIEIVGLDARERWEALAAHAPPSQSWRYAHALQPTGIEPQLAAVEAGDARMLLPFYERTWGGRADIASYLATTGLSVSPDSAEPLRAWQDHARERGWVAGYLQLATDVDLVDAGVGEFVDLNEWFVLDLAQAPAREQLAESLRHKLRHAERDGVELRAGADALATDFLRLYPQALRRVGASALYHFPPETLDRWLADPDTLVLGAAVDGVVEAVSLFLVGGSQAEYHLNASSDRGRDFAAPILWEAIRRLREAGVARLHLGGGVRRGDGLHAFKQRFRGTPRPLRALRQVYDAEAFVALCRQAGVPEHGGNYFPPYRAKPAPA